MVGTDMRKIAIVTGTRAEYGLLYWLISRVHQDPQLELQLVVTGMHLSPEFGLTVKQIEADGFPIAARVEMLLSSDTEVGVTKSLGLGVISFADAYSQLRPDLVTVLGDRFEIFGAVAAAMIARIPVAHCHGGEATEGLIDESIRHSITKMSHLHFVANDEYGARVRQLGEQPDRVFNVGALGIENINRLKLMDREAFEKSIDLKLGKTSALVTFHPVTLEYGTAARQFCELTKALEAFPEMSVIFTKPNADTDGRVIISLIDEFVERHPLRARGFISLGQLRFLSAMRHVSFVIGNSSSGLVEAPSFKIPTINIGDRQRGRIMADTVIPCGAETSEIISAIQKATGEAFLAMCKQAVNPYGDGNASAKILPILKSAPLEGILKKIFYDIR